MNNKNRLHFIKTTLIGGAIFLLPVAVLMFVLGEAMDVMLLIAEPMVEFFPVDSIGGIALANLLALAGVIFFCFVAGLLARRAFADTFISALESKILVKIPGYALIKGLAGGIHPDVASNMKPVLLTLGRTQRIGLEVEALSDGRSVVYLPSPPTALSGITLIAPSEDIQYLDVSVFSIMENIEQYSIGTENLINKAV